MTFRKLTVCFLAFCWLIYSVDTVSFYGESYIHIPFRDAFSQTDLELRFKTSRPYGILVLLFGRTDYMLIQLHHGTLEVKISLDTEETLLDLGEQRYDDLQWHTVKFTMKANHVTVTTDTTPTMKKQITGDARTLSIDSGVYLGGVDHKLSEIFQHELKNFRGTFSELFLNGMDMISMAQSLTDPTHIADISWDIDKLFSAPRSKQISFQSETSYISFSHIHPASERTVSLLIKTDTPTAMVVYTIAQHSISRHFIALQLVDHELSLTVGKGEELVTVTSDIVIDSKHWHQVSIEVRTEMIVLIVDGVKVTKTFEDRSGAVYGGLIFLGGVNQKSRAQAISDHLPAVQGENVMKGGMVGCMDAIIINSRVYNVHDIHASRYIQAGCDLEHPCEFENCVDLKPYSDSSQDGFQLLSVHQLTVEEGGSEIITKENIEIVYNFKAYGIRESGIMIKVVDEPKYGDIQVDLSRRFHNGLFTYLDLVGGKVRYIHHGSEENYDEVGMEIEMHSSRQLSPDIPAQLQRQYSFILPINIKPTNDPPRIILGNNGYLRIIENTKIRVTSDILSAVDPDTPASELKYIVMNNPSFGYFEKVGRIGQPIVEFTQEEINDRQIWFLHPGSGQKIIQIKLTDGQAESNMIELRVQTVSLQLTITQNTGLVLPHGTFGIISADNLTTTSNVPTQELEIRYEVRQQPKYGVIERQQYTDGEWYPERLFAQRHIDLGHVRYRQTDPFKSPSSDQFTFFVMAKNFKSPYYYFIIKFEPIDLSLEANNKLTVLHQPYGIISPENLSIKTNNPQLRMDLIKYTILRQTSLGDFYKIDSRKRGHIDFAENMRLSKESVFTQADINNGNIYYKLKSSTFEKVTDFADLHVYTVGTATKTLRFWIDFIPLKSDIRFINKGLTNVIEGGQRAIDKHSLYIQTDNFSVFEFTVITPLQHGQLQLVHPRSSAVLDSRVKEFTNEDIKNDRLVYKHDDSEHDRDSFTFTAVPVIHRTSLAQSEIPEFTGTFEIHMLMRNDNPPERSVDKVFKVVRNKEKLITIEDLAFTDPDIEYDTNELLYTKRGIANGDIIHSVNKSQIYTFKQRDIINKQVMFRHHGEDFDGVTIYVTDGQFYVNCLFEIEAGDPFVQIVDNTGIIVSNNKNGVISAKNLSIETNVNADERNVRFVLIEEPRQGFLGIGDEEVLEFSLADLKASKVTYHHEGGARLEDEFKFAAVVQDIQTQGTFQIQILMEASKVPPRVINNHVLEVFGATERNVIEESHLLITHPKSTPEDIVYLVLVLPRYGKLYRSDNELMVDSDMTFTQADINNGLVTYKLENSSATTDQFIYEVTNGYESLRGLEFMINIIPSNLPLETKNFSVKEGGRKAITLEELQINRHFLDENSIQFYVKEKPKHGIIELNSNKGEAISDFSVEDLKNKNVFYSHDDSESQFDRFSLNAVLKDGTKESEMRTMFVTVEGMNDEPPVIVRNEGLTVWKGSMTQITSDILKAQDPDTPPEQLTYRISTPTNGHLSLLNNTFRSIVIFRQSWIDDGNIVFVHTGGSTGQFSFQVTDGHSSNELSLFKVTAKQLILTLDVKKPLHAYPVTNQPITSGHLSASTNDPEQAKPIIFTLTKKPVHGKIVTMVDGSPAQVSSFTQEEINGLQIYYRHYDILNGWTQNDSIEFTVSTLYADKLPVQLLNIQISYGNLNAENKNQLIRTSPIRVHEGGEMYVAKENLDVTEFVKNLEKHGKRVSLRFSLSDAPKYGMLVFQGTNLLKSKRFSQRDINKHALIYKHDDSNTVSDLFNLTLHLRIEDKSLHGGHDNESMIPVDMNVTIQPVNDDPFRLVTVNPSLHITQGFTVVINKTILYTEDNDTSPAYLQYKIIRDAKHGHVAFIEDEFSPIESFSQQDINDGRVVFRQDGSNESDTFYFQVSDGAFRPYYRGFNVHVSAVNMNISKNATVLITQSDTSVLITPDYLNISTNGKRDNVTYVVIQKPRFGKIYLTSREVYSFTQFDLDQHKVLYVQDNLISGFDSFICDIKYNIGNLNFRKKIVRVRVDPLVNIGPLEAPKGERVALTLFNLDASKLSERTADNPVYSISDGPYYGRIVKKSFSKRQVSHEPYEDNSGFREVREFSHEDVVYMKVFYENNEYHNSNAEKQDNFTFVLSAFNVQPAEGMFYVKLTPSNKSPIIPVSKPTIRKGQEPVTRKSVTTPGVEQGGERKSSMNDGSVEPSSVKHDHVIVLAILIPLLLIIIIIIIVVFFVWRRHRKRDYAPSSKKSPGLRPQISGPFQIEQPHVHIEPQELDEHTEEDAKSLVEYENMSSIPGAACRLSEETDVVTPMTSHELPPHIPRSPDISRTEVSYTVPYCKVTPLVNTETSDEDRSPDDVRKSNSSMGDMVDWITSDPELLQHCSSSTPPVLRKNQYWV